MMEFDYFGRLTDAIEFLIALGSIIGLLGLVIGIIFIALGGKRLRWKMIGVIIVSIILIGICGLNTGVKYFRIFR